MFAVRFEESMDIVVDAEDDIHTADEAEQQIRGDVLGSWALN